MGLYFAITSLLGRCEFLNLNKNCLILKVLNIIKHILILYSLIDYLRLFRQSVGFSNFSCAVLPLVGIPHRSISIQHSIVVVKRVCTLMCHVRVLSHHCIHILCILLILLGLLVAGLALVFSVFLGVRGPSLASDTNKIATRGIRRSRGWLMNLSVRERI